VGVIEAANLNKSFMIPSVRRHTVREHVFSLFRQRKFERLQVLNNVSFELEHGKTLGIMGRNGSGKSTLLKIICGIYRPDSGELAVRSAITPILELGVGWNAELDAIDNIVLLGTAMGLSLAEARKATDSILAFAEVERFANLELKNYSSGMASRLAYAVAFHSAREVLVLDEILAVGDAGFKLKCEARYKEMISKGHSGILVAHDAGFIERHCSHAILLESGRVTRVGTGTEIAAAYLTQATAAAAVQAAG
jgi:ABC-type polysaccharide/polyol phosphate transport system ATPase subunit